MHVNIFLLFIKVKAIVLNSLHKLWHIEFPATFLCKSRSVQFSVALFRHKVGFCPFLKEYSCRWADSFLCATIQRLFSFQFVLFVLPLVLPYCRTVALWLCLSARFLFIQIAFVSVLMPSALFILAGCVFLPSICLNIYAFLHPLANALCIRLGGFPSVSGRCGPSIDAMVSILLAARLATPVAVAIAIGVWIGVGQIHIRFGHDWRAPRNLSPHSCRSSTARTRARTRTRTSTKGTSGSPGSWLSSFGAVLLKCRPSLWHLPLLLRQRLLLLNFMWLLMLLLWLSKCRNVSDCFLLKTFASHIVLRLLHILIFGLKVIFHSMPFMMIVDMQVY